MAVSCYECCQDSATGRSLVQRNTTECVCVSRRMIIRNYNSLHLNEKAEDIRLRKKEEKKERKIERRKKIL
jgi:hypothetical protein